MIIHQIVFDATQKSMRLNDFIQEQFTSFLPSKSSVKKAFKKKLILLNNRAALIGDSLCTGDVVALREDVSFKNKVFPLDLPILFEDQDIALITKPAGFSVSGNFFKTIQNAIPHNLSKSTKKDALSVPRPVHRLDKLTSGILLVAKTHSAQISLGKQFEDQEIHKTYYALVKGKLSGTGVFDASIDGQVAVTNFNSVRVEKSLSYDWVSLIELNPITGRTHQLRIHLAHAGHPIIGDYLHDSSNVLKGKGLFLSSSKIGFKHPISQNYKTFEIPIPTKYASLFERELRRWNKFNS